MRESDYQRTNYIKNININPFLKWMYLKNKYVIPREIPNNPELPPVKTSKNVESPKPPKDLFTIKRKKSSVSPYNIGDNIAV